MNSHICEQCQEGQKLTEEGRLLKKINRPTERAWGSLIAKNRGLGYISYK